MKIPVYSHDLSITQRLCKKSLSYCASIVSYGHARWVDSADFSKGIVGLRRLDLRESEADASLKRAAGWGFDTAWSMRESGYGGPLVWQLNTPLRVNA